MKQYLLGLMFILFTGCAALPGPQTHFSIADQEALATVHIVKDAYEACSGVVVAPGHLLTAAHCMDLSKNGEVIVGKVHYKVASGEAAKNFADHAIFYVPGLPCPCAPVAEFHPLPGDQVIAIGYPYALGKTLTRGEYMEHATLPIDPMDPSPYGSGEAYLMMTVAVLPGNSGGGDFVMRDGKWYLVGVTSRGAGQILLSSDITNYKEEFLNGKK